MFQRVLLSAQSLVRLTLYDLLIHQFVPELKTTSFLSGYSMTHSGRSVQSLFTTLFATFMLVSCSSSLEVSRQYCPTEGVLADTERLVGGAADRVWQSQISGTALECSWDAEKRKLVTALTVRGTVMASEEEGVPSKLTLPAFVVVLDAEDKQLYRKNFDISVSADKNPQLVAFSKEVGELILTLAPGDRIKDHAVLVGFRLTPDQLRANRSYRIQKLGL